MNLVLECVEDSLIAVNSREAPLVAGQLFVGCYYSLNRETHDKIFPGKLFEKGSAKIRCVEFTEASTTIRAWGWSLYIIQCWVSVVMLPFNSIGINPSFLFSQV